MVELDCHFGGGPNFARASMELTDLGARAVKEHSRTFEKLVMGQLWETMGPKPLMIRWTTTCV